MTCADTCVYTYGTSLEKTVSFVVNYNKYLILKVHSKHYFSSKYDILTAVLIKIQVFWNITPCR